MPILAATEVQMPSMDKRCEVRLAEKDDGHSRAEVYLYGVIGGYFDGVSAKDFLSAWQQARKADEITLHIHSPGGDAFDGAAIYNTVAKDRKRVTVVVDGAAFSAASLIAMAGNRLYMSAVAMMMIHSPWTVAMGNGTEFREVAERLDQIRDTMVGAYSKKSGMDRESVTAALESETWYSPETAIDAGFVDGILGEEEIEAPENIAAFLDRVYGAPQLQYAAVLNQLKGLGGMPPATEGDERMAEKKTMAVPDSVEAMKEACPDLVKQIQDAAFASGREEGIQAERQRATSIRALVKDREHLESFAGALADRGSSPEEAAAMLDIADEQFKAGRLSGDLVESHLTEMSASRETESTPEETWKTFIDTKVKAGLSRVEAFAALTKERPDLHEQYVRDAGKEA